MQFFFSICRNCHVSWNEFFGDLFLGADMRTVALYEAALKQ